MGIRFYVIIISAYSFLERHVGSDSMYIQFYVIIKSTGRPVVDFSCPRSSDARSTDARMRRSSFMPYNGSIAASSANHNLHSFSPETVAASSKSFLEVLHILTLHAHTLDECSGLHQALQFLDHEQKMLSSTININLYLGRLIDVPNSLSNV